MIVITGGAYQGKEAFARQLYVPDQNGISIENPSNVKTEDIKTEHCVLADETASVEVLQSAAIWNHYHLWVARQLKEDADPWGLTEQILEKNPGIIICSTELGCGIVPVDAFDREWREVTGRMCCMLAKKADAVYRVNCGIGVRIK